MFKPINKSSCIPDFNINKLIINFNKKQLGNKSIKPKQVEENLQAITVEEPVASTSLFEIY